MWCLKLDEQENTYFIHQLIAHKRKTIHHLDQKSDPKLPPSPDAPNLWYFSVVEMLSYFYLEVGDSYEFKLQVNGFCEILD